MMPQTPAQSLASVSVIRTSWARVILGSFTEFSPRLESAGLGGPQLVGRIPDLLTHTLKQKILFSNRGRAMLS
jgi:hypothetical protein